MDKTIQCRTHGETQRTYVCSHLAERVAGLGFNRAEPTAENPFPDAWCDDCNLICEAHNGWNDESEQLAKNLTLCSACYELSRIRNTRTDVTFDDLSTLRWKCHSCEEWHSGPCLDFSYDAPYYWSEENGNGVSFEPDGTDFPDDFLTEDVCAIDGEHFFVRGIIHLPIIGTVETLRWGVWGSLSQENFRKLIANWNDEKRADLPPMFSWLSSNIAEYPDTINLKMYAHIKEPGERVIFELEPTDHPLSREYYEGISPERVREIMTRQLKETE